MRQESTVAEDALLAEYTALRSEMKLRTTLQERVISWLIPVLAAFLGAVIYFKTAEGQPPLLAELLSTQSRQAVSAFGMLSAALCVTIEALIAYWAYQLYQIFAMSEYISLRIGPGLEGLPDTQPGFLLLGWDEFICDPSSLRNAFFQRRSILETESPSSKGKLPISVAISLEAAPFTQLVPAIGLTLFSLFGLVYSAVRLDRLQEERVSMDGSLFIAFMIFITGLGVLTLILTSLLKRKRFPVVALTLFSALAVAYLTIGLDQILKEGITIEYSAFIDLVVCITGLGVLVLVRKALTKWRLLPVVLLTAFSLLMLACSAIILVRMPKGSVAMTNSVFIFCLIPIAALGVSVLVKKALKKWRLFPVVKLATFSFLVLVCLAIILGRTLRGGTMADLLLIAFVLLTIGLGVLLLLIMGIHKWKSKGEHSVF